MTINVCESVCEILLVTDRLRVCDRTTLGIIEMLHTLPIYYSLYHDQRYSSLLCTQSEMKLGVCVVKMMGLKAEEP